MILQSAAVSVLRDAIAPPSTGDSTNIFHILEIKQNDLNPGDYTVATLYTTIKYRKL